VFAEDGIVEDEVRAGLFDGAEIAISFVNWQDPDGHGEVRLRRGTLGETRLTPQGYFHAELRGLSQQLVQSTLEVFSPNCRADLGDERCKFPIEPPELGRDQAASKGAFYRVPTTAGTGSARYEDRIYEVIEAGTTLHARGLGRGGDRPVEVRDGVRPCPFNLRSATESLDVRRHPCSEPRSYTTKTQSCRPPGLPTQLTSRLVG
jgi:hypothetical protein